jgi:hypothetical protein
MAEKKDLKKTPAKGAPAGKSTAKAKGESRASKSKTNTVAATAASKAPAGTKKKKTTAKPSSDAKKTASPKSPSKKEKEEQQAAKIRRKSVFSEQFLPYIFVGFALLFAVFMILNMLEGADTAATHPAGLVGFYFCQALFGCFGWAAYLIPLLFINLAAFWRRY